MNEAHSGLVTSDTFVGIIFSKLWQEKAKLLLQSYLDNVLVDDRLNQSEIIYSFLSPSPDYLKTASSVPPSIARYL